MNKADLIYERFNFEEIVWMEVSILHYAGSYGIKEEPWSLEFPLQGYIVEWMNVGMYGLKKMEFYN